MQATYSGVDKRLQYLFQNANHVEATQTVATGTKIGTISIDGVATDLYSPSGSSVTCNPLVNEGTAIALFTIGNRTYTIYSPVQSQISYTDLIGNQIQVDEGTPAVTVYDEPSYKIGTLVISSGADFRPSADTDVVAGKTYYERTETYIAVTPSAGDNPSEEGWYERSGNNYVRTSDTSVVSGKTYYELSVAYIPVTPTAGDNPSQEGWYELGGTPIPIYAPPATGVEYISNYQTGIHVGVLKVRTVGNDTQHEDNPATVDLDTYDIIVPSGSQGGSIVSYSQLYPSTGEHIGTITIDGVAQSIYAPTGGGSGNVADVYVDGSSVVDSNHIAQISLTNYATDTELSTAVQTLQANFQVGVDSIYNACVSKGSTPASHSLTDVVNGILAIPSGGGGAVTITASATGYNITTETATSNIVAEYTITSSAEVAS